MRQTYIVQIPVRRILDRNCSNCVSTKRLLCLFKIRIIQAWHIIVTAKFSLMYYYLLLLASSPTEKLEYTAKAFSPLNLSISIRSSCAFSDVSLCKTSFPVKGTLSITDILSVFLDISFQKFKKN